MAIRHSTQMINTALRIKFVMKFIFSKAQRYFVMPREGIFARVLAGDELQVDDQIDMIE